MNLGEILTNENIPFAPIGLQEGKLFLHMI